MFNVHRFKMCNEFLQKFKFLLSFVPNEMAFQRMFNMFANFMYS